MKLTRPQRLILYALGKFYEFLNQPLEEKLLHIQTSKIAFIEHLKKSKILTKQERAIYKNLETLEQKSLITYENHMIHFTPLGITELKKIEQDLNSFINLKEYFQTTQKPKRKLQTVLTN